MHILLCLVKIDTCSENVVSETVGPVSEDCWAAVIRVQTNYSIAVIWIALQEPGFNSATTFHLPYLEQLFYF